MINIYTGNNERQRERPFENLGKWMCTDAIMVGDFNVV